MLIASALKCTFYAYFYSNRGYITLIYHVPLCVLNVMPATLGIVIAAMRVHTSAI